MKSNDLSSTLGNAEGISRPEASTASSCSSSTHVCSPGRTMAPAGSFSLPTIAQPWPVIEIIQEKPWLLEVWELLKTKAPNPTICQPYCCYFRTVIFYLKPYVIRPWHHFWNCRGRLKAEKPGHHFEQWDEIEYALVWDTPLEFNGERFEVGGGTVIWRNKQWWMRHWARRKKEAA